MMYLEPEQLRAVKAEARARGISVAEFLRRLVQEHLEQRRVAFPTPAEAYGRIVGLGASRHDDIAKRHDAYLAEAIRDEHAR